MAGDPELPPPLLTLPPELLLTIAELLPTKYQSRLLRTNIRLANVLTPLLNSAANQTAQAGGMPLLHWAVLRNDVRLIRLLLANGVVDVAHPGYCMYTALHLAVAHAGAGIVRVLLEGENGESVRGVRDCCGRTPLGIAVMRGAKGEIVEMLRGNGRVEEV
ncbi:hypothetical protein L873DRAFT_1789272 [Choiromyces venosus 120613-1]|uniref:Uncharacterized protein n=1 Tax=Choiromyces venosus 120613-1 TaxID=1336337 RepID=A0A3N4K2E9_9PEZI|nr:hypothetical protein L873DRAFT_1789272 [Choiromyces venosus 120613-1]